MWPPSQQFANTAEQQCNKSGTKTAAADVWLWQSSKTVKLKSPTWQLISYSFILNSLLFRLVIHTETLGRLKHEGVADTSFAL